MELLNLIKGVCSDTLNDEIVKACAGNDSFYLKYYTEMLKGFYHVDSHDTEGDYYRLQGYFYIDEIAGREFGEITRMRFGYLDYRGKGPEVVVFFQIWKLHKH